MRKILYISVTTLVLIVFASCKDQNQHVHTLSGIPKTGSAAHADTIAFDENIFPVDSLLKIRVLTTGEFHADEINPGNVTAEWSVLFKGPQGCYLKRTSIIAKRTYDPVTDAETDTTGWLISTPGTDTCVMLIQPQPFLSDRVVSQIVLPRNTLDPQDSVGFSLSRKAYRLVATGRTRKPDGTSDESLICNYKLFLKAYKNGKPLNQLLVARPRLIENKITIIFVGDIDGDGTPDLIIDTSPDGNEAAPTLYLSGPATGDHLVIPVGVHISHGC